MLSLDLILGRLTKKCLVSNTIGTRFSLLSSHTSVRTGSFAVEHGVAGVQISIWPRTATHLELEFILVDFMPSFVVCLAGEIIDGLVSIPYGFWMLSDVKFMKLYSSQKKSIMLLFRLCLRLVQFRHVL